MGFVASVCHPSTLRMLIWPEASSAQNSIAAVSAEGSTVCVLILRLKRYLHVTGDRATPNSNHIQDGIPRSVREPLDSHGSRCSAVGTRGQQLYLVHGLLLLPVGFSWPVASVEQCSPFAPAPLQDLHHYYGLLRPCAPHRYSRPHGFSRLRLLPLHRCDRFSRSIQEPGWASRRLHAGYRSGRLQGSPELIPEDGSAPGFDIV